LIGTDVERRKQVRKVHFYPETFAAILICAALILFANAFGGNLSD